MVPQLPRSDRAAHPETASRYRRSAEKKTLELLPVILGVGDECRNVFAQDRTAQRARRLGLSAQAGLDQLELAQRLPPPSGAQ